MYSKNILSVLAVVNEPVSLKMAVTMLQKNGYHVDSAIDGRAAWELIENECHYDLIVTDIAIPRMDGFQLSERIRERYPLVPVIIISADDDKETIKKALRIGVNDFLERPLDRDELLRSVNRVLLDHSSIGKRNKLRHTVTAVRRAQQALLSTDDRESPFHVFARPLEDAGGDVFRYRHCPAGGFFFMIADVAGHSVESSYVAASFLGIFSSSFVERMDFSTLLLKLNQGVKNGPFPSIHVCALFGRWTPDKGRLHLINAGIPYPLWYRRRLDRTDILDFGGSPLGLIATPQFDQRMILLEEGDRVLLGSDGFFDADSPDGISFERESPFSFQRTRDLPMPVVLEQLARDASDWSGGRLSDDLLIVGFEQPPMCG